MQEEVIINKIEASNAKLENIEEKQELFENSIQNKYNHLSSVTGKIHQKVKSSNNKYSKLVDDIQELKALVAQNKNKEIISKLDMIMDNLDQQKPVTPHNETSGQVDFVDYKAFMNKWFNKNLKITRNPYQVVDLEDVKTKLDKYLDSEDVSLDRQVLYNRLESYLKSWYNTHDVKINFNDIISTSINDKKLYSYLTFIDIKQERENRIKNSVVVWLKEHTCEVENSKTYTEDILKNIVPLFEENGWIITSPEEYNKLQEAGFTKVCVKRTFSQIIGKSVQEVYDHITKNSIGRDTPGNGNVTWYPNIQIIDKKVSDNVQSTIKDELSNDIFDSDNIVCKWLNNHLNYTGLEGDCVDKGLLLDKLRKYLRKEDAMISEDTLQRLFTNTLNWLTGHYNVRNADNDTLIGFRILLDLDIDELLLVWLDNHLEYTGECDDRVSQEILDEKLLTYLYRKNVTIIRDDVYQQLPNTLKKNFIQESEYRTTLNNILSQKVSEYDENISFIGSYTLVEYNNLKRSDVTQWVQHNIQQLLKNNVSNKKEILENFNQYMDQTKTKNNTGTNTEQILDEEIQEYYTQQNTTLKLLNDTHDEYYVIITP